MKHIFVFALAALTLASCQSTTKKATETEAAVEAAVGATADTAVVASSDVAVISFEKESHNFGKIKPGEKVYYSYKFKNIGKSPLIITDATATCGCTVPEIPKEPIKPGAEGEIRVVFDSNGKSGLQDKIITVTSNARPNIASLHLIGEITEQSK